jgi:PhnB protein
MTCMPVQYKPDRFHTVTPHLTVKGASDYIDFLKRAFGAVESSRSPGPSGKLMHAELLIGDSVLMLNDDFPEFGAPPIGEGSWPVTFHLYVPDADATLAQATAAGCEVTMPLSNQFWGDRYSQVKDPYGFKWAIATRKEELTPAEMQQRAAKLFGGGPPAAAAS